MRQTICFVISVFLLAASSRSDGQEKSITVGERATLHSAVLNEDRPQMIVVAIPNTDRTRDLTTPDRTEPFRILIGHSLGGLFAVHRTFKKFLYMSLGGEGDRMQNPLTGLTKVLEENAPSGFMWKYLQMPEETHGTTPLRSAYEGLKFIFTGFAYAPFNADSGLSKLLQHYADLSERFGYRVNPPETVVNTFGYVLLQEKKTPEAIAMFRYNIQT